MNFTTGASRSPWRGPNRRAMAKEGRAAEGRLAHGGLYANDP